MPQIFIIMQGHGLVIEALVANVSPERVIIITSNFACDDLSETGNTSCSHDAYWKANGVIYLLAILSYGF